MGENMEFEKPKSITEQVCKSLVKAIIEGKLKPGDPLTEAKLNEQFGIDHITLQWERRPSLNQCGDSCEIE